MGLKNMYVSYTKKSIDPDLGKARRVLYYCIDGIGDAVLESPVFSRLPEIFPNAEFTVFCQTVSEGFYLRCPFVSRVISIDSKKTQQAGYLDEIFQTLREVKADIVLNLVLNPSSGLVMLLWAAQAPIMSVLAELPDAREDMPEDKRYIYDFAKSLGAVIPVKHAGSLIAEMDNTARAFGLEPQERRVWIAREDEEEAGAFFDSSGLNPEKNIALAGISSSPYKDYPYFSEALLPVCLEHGLSVTALGGQKEAAANGAMLARLEAHGVRTLNASGKTSLMASAALLRKSCLVLGVDTGLLHLACAMKLPNIVILSGGATGRVWPSSPYSSVACLPLSCICCGWDCPYPECFCLTGMPPEFVTETLNYELRRLYPESFGTSAEALVPGASCARAAEPGLAVDGAVFMQKRDCFEIPVSEIFWKSPSFIINHAIPAKHLHFGIRCAPAPVEEILRTLF